MAVLPFSNFFPMRTIKSRTHDYTVEDFSSLGETFRAVSTPDRAFWLVDKAVATCHAAAFTSSLRTDRTIFIQASEEQKSFEALTPVFLALLSRGLKRDSVLVVVGGGVLQDIGCFIASVLFRGIRWEMIPTTLLAQADSCIGSKSSVNIGSYKNQIGTFYPPHRVLIATSVLATLPWDEVRSGLGEIIKLQLLHGEIGFHELLADLRTFAPGHPDPALIAKWVSRSMDIKQPYIEADEYDRGIRNILNYGHTFGHAYESASHYGIPHGIAVVLGMLTATFLSVRLGIVSKIHYNELKTSLHSWHEPYGEVLKTVEPQLIFQAIKHDKKNTGDSINCILTRGPGRMEKQKVCMAEDLIPAVTTFIANETSL